MLGFKKQSPAPPAPANPASSEREAPVVTKDSPPPSSAPPAPEPVVAPAQAPVPKLEVHPGTSIAADTKIRGDLKTDTSLSVAGVVEGNLDAAGPVLISGSARVQGDVIASDISVEGLVEGNVTATGKLTITATGTVLGDITVRSLLILEGGTLQGQCHMGEQSRDETVQVTSSPVPVVAKPDALAKQKPKQAAAPVADATG